MKREVKGPAGFIYYRIIALWVVCEAMLGGIIHGLHIPVSGLVVGSAAVICICLLAYYVPSRGTIIKAAFIVAIFKMMLSPQAPPPAYVAVFFQGLMGEILFWNRRFYRLSCFLLGVIALLESGFQRILVLTIVYGTDLWKAVNDFIDNLIGKTGTINYSFFIISWYVLIHVVAGLLVGLWAGMLPQDIRQLGPFQKKYAVDIQGQNETNPPEVRKNKKSRWAIFIIWAILILLYAQSSLGIGPPLLPSNIALRIFLRSIIIVLAWYFVVAPLLKKYLAAWLQKKKEKSSVDIRHVLELLPATQKLISGSWQLSAEKRGIKRVILCCKIILANSFYQSQTNIQGLTTEANVYILTGPVHTGKTTTLLNWSDKRDDVYGILTPIVNGSRMFMNIHGGEQFLMEAMPGETGVFYIGKFSFSKAAFEKAIKIIRDNKSPRGWLIIDEIGPLELKGEGFSRILREIIKQRTDQKIILVVRDSIVQEVINYLGLDAEKVIVIGKEDPLFETII